MGCSRAVALAWGLAAGLGLVGLGLLEGTPAEAAPTAGQRVLDFVVDAASDHVTLGALQEHLPTIALTATPAASGGVLLSPRLGGVRAPTRWTLRVEHTNRRGVVVGRELPVVGEGVPPVALWVAPPPATLHLRLTLELELGRFDGATSAPLVSPPLPEPLPPPVEQRTLSIDGRVARLPPGPQALTLELDAPATLTLRVEDARGTRWIRRGVSRTDVRRPVTERRPEVALEVARRQLAIGPRLVEVPTGGRILRAGGDGLSTWAELEPLGPGTTAWRLTWGAGDEVVAERLGLGPPPARVERATTTAAQWVELEQTTRSGWWLTTGRQPATSEAPSAALRLEVRAVGAGELVEVGTASAARARLAP